MTVTDTGRRTAEQLLAQAREKYAGTDLPTKSEMAKELKTHFNTAKRVHEALTGERQALASSRRREARQRMTQLARRKRNGRVPVVRMTPFTVPSGPVSAVPSVPVADQVDIPLHAPVVGPFWPLAAEPSEPAPETSPEPVVVPAGRTESEVRSRRLKTWPIFLLALPAFVAIWSGWVDLGRLTGFGVVHPFPGIWDDARLNTAITLPIGLETYAAYALYVWLSGEVPAKARRFAKWSAIGSLALGAAGQVAYHLMVAAGMERAPWQITTVVACLPVAVLGMGAALRHLVRADEVPS